MTNAKDERATVKPVFLTSPKSSKKKAKEHKKGKVELKPKERIVVASLLQGNVVHFDVLTKDSLVELVDSNPPWMAQPTWIIIHNPLCLSHQAPGFLLHQASIIICDIFWISG